MRLGLSFSAALAAAVLAALAVAPGAAQDAPLPAPPSGTLLEFHFTPTRYAQLALWLERADGTFLTTVRLTEAVAKRGIGNRPGASQMNSGFRWPYGRREGALPVWAKRRADAPGAQQFRRVIFQDRRTEGLASQTSADQSIDNYYCLTFDRSDSSKGALEAMKDALDAVSCASPFHSDKGRFITEADVANGYAEPYEPPGGGEVFMRPLSFDSLYPPRRDITSCVGLPGGCFDHADTAVFDAHVREVLPEIDTITMATPQGSREQKILYMADFEPGDYRACVEVNVEGDYNEVWNERSFPTPSNPSSGEEWWDSPWATDFGYPYRGQPSVVYCTEFEVGSEDEQSFSVAEPTGSAGSWDHHDPTFGEMRPMDGMTDDPAAAPGSGADRLLLMGAGERLTVVVKPPWSCDDNAPPDPVEDLEVTEYEDERNAHQWAHLRFRAAQDELAIHRYDVRVSTSPITDDASFMAATAAKQATLEGAELLVPTAAPAGELIDIDFGGLVASTSFFIAVRPMDTCAAVGPIRVVEFTTQARVFATVSPCFVATAAWGSELAGEVSILRRARDRYLMSNGLGRALVSAYYAAGPTLAGLIREREGLRSAARIALLPAVEFARWLDRPSP